MLDAQLRLRCLQHYWRSPFCGCTTAQGSVATNGSNLAAACFVAQRANTLKRLATMKRLSPNTFVKGTRSNQISYVYADPPAANGTDGVVGIGAPLADLLSLWEVRVAAWPFRFGFPGQLGDDLGD